MGRFLVIGEGVVSYLGGEKQVFVDGMQGWRGVLVLVLVNTLEGGRRWRAQDGKRGEGDEGERVTRAQEEK